MKASRLSFLVFSASLLAHSQSFGQATWVGAGVSGTPALWSDPLNWTGTPPVDNATTSLTFLNTAGNSFSSNDRTGLTITSITVPATDGAVIPVNIKDNNIEGNAFTLSGGVTISTGNWQSITNNIALTGTIGFTVNSGQLTLGGDLSNGTSVGALQKIGGATLVLKGTGSMTGGGSQTVAAGTPGGGSYTVPLVFNSSSAGTVVLQNTAAFGSAALRGIQFNSGGNGTLDLQTDTSVNGYGIFAGSGGTTNTIISNLLNNGAGITHNLGVVQLGSAFLTINQGSKVTSGTAGVSFTAVSLTAGNNDRPATFAGSAAVTVGDVATTANASNSRRLGLAGTNANNAVTGVISNLATGISGASVLSLIKSNSSTWTLSGANTYTGITTIAGGTLQLGNGGTTGSLSIVSAIQNGGTLAINRSDTVTQGVDFASVISAYATDYSTSAAGVALVTPVSGVLRKSGAGNLILNAANTLAVTDSLTFSGSGSGTVTLTDPAALGAAGNMVRFSGSGSGVLDLQTDTSVNAYGIASGTFNGGTIIANRATPGAGITHALGILDLSSVTITIGDGSNVVSGTSTVTFPELKMSGGNDFNPVTIASDVNVTIGSASITNNGLSKRLKLDGTSSGNLITGVISDTANAVVGAKVNVIKSGTSTWRLQGNNTYTGDTTVSSGTLEIDLPYLNDSAVVSIDGVLKLNHASTDVVGSLYLGGVLQGPGVYDSSNTAGLIIGTGKLQVLGSSPFETWAQANITAINPSANATATGDPDGDGSSNLAEFAFRGNPLSGSDNGIVRVFTTDTTADVETVNKELVLTMAIRKGNAAAFAGSPLQLTTAGVTYTVQGSLDLAIFSAAVTEVTPIAAGLPDLTADPDYEYRSFSLGSSDGLVGKGFLRAKVEK